MLSVEKVLNSKGPLLSSDVKEHLLKSGISEDAARQHISRAQKAGQVVSHQGIKFPKRAKFLYLKTHLIQDQVEQALLKALLKHSPAHAAAIGALRARGGLCTYDHILAACGSPIAQKGQVPSEIVIDQLKKARIISIINSDEYGQLVRFTTYVDEHVCSEREWLARSKVEDVMLNAVSTWIRKLSLASYDALRFRGDGNEPVPVGNFHWDITGPSYLSNMKKVQNNGGPIPGFVVCDVAYNEQIDEHAMAAVVRKCRMTTALKNIPTIMPFFIAGGFTREAFALAKKEGVVPATIENLFGKEVAVGLSALLQTLTKIASIAVHKPEVVGELFDKLKNIEGAAGNIRGALFEMLVGHYASQKGGNIEIGGKVKDPDNGKHAEIDVISFFGKESVTVYECKGYQSTQTVSLEDVQHWVTNRVPLIYRALKSERAFNRSKFIFEFWNCGQFDDEAANYLQNKSARTSKYSIKFIDGIGVRKALISLNNQAIIKIFDEHYSKHPISKALNKHSK